MLSALAFLNPWLLTGLLALPIIWWLLRTVPPRPERIAFPPTRILVGLEDKEKTPAKTPWWLMLIRMAAAALVILALAEPILNPSQEAGLKGSGPVAIVVDNGWASGTRWAERVRKLESTLAEAESQRRPVLVAATALTTKVASYRIESPASARSTAAAMVPQPFAPSRAEAARALEAALAGQKGVAIVWLTDGIDHTGEAKAFADRLAALAGDGGSLAVVVAKPGEEAVALGARVGNRGRLEADVLRAEGGAREGQVLAYSAKGQRLGEAIYKIETGAAKGVATFDLPLELRNQVTRIEIAGERSAGAVHLLDARSRWHRVALVSGVSREQAQPLLGPLYYLERALAPFAELVAPRDSNIAAAIDDAFKQNASALVLADIGTLPDEVKEKVEKWVRSGGILVRFAGPRLEKGGDDLLPGPLRLGGRTLGGALSWSTPQPLDNFDNESPFVGLPVPPEVLVNRQVLADPSRRSAEVRDWARLKDGTPLVTARRLGDGELVLFHVTANSDWSNLPLSGLFVEMVRRIANRGGEIRSGGDAANADAKDPKSAAGDGSEVLVPVQTLDGLGLLKPPPPTAQAIGRAQLAIAIPSLDHPPGYYGPAGAPRALNLVGPKTELKPLPGLPALAERRAYEGTISQPLKPWLLSAALALIFIDIIAVLLLQMGARLIRRPAAATTGAIIVGLLTVLAATALVPADAFAQGAATPADRRAIQATGKVTFAYVVTGDSSVDNTSRQGLVGLGKVLTLRTAVEPGEPFAVNIETDELAFYPILYWPVVTNARPLSTVTLARIDAYMKQGGMIIFDTRDYGQALPGTRGAQGPGAAALQRLVGKLDLPRLEPAGDDHVLTKAFYLLKAFPGRWDGGQLWVEAQTDGGPEEGRKARRADGVSSILITSNDFASAWALDDRNRPLYPVVPGGEAQREMAFRAGVNIVMYALTGNYKADQVHAPELLKRLGQ